MLITTYAEVKKVERLELQNRHAALEGGNHDFGFSRLCSLLRLLEQIKMIQKKKDRNELG